MSNDKENESDQYERDLEQNRSNAAIEYEHVLRELWGKRPKNFQNWMSLEEPRGGVAGYADADIWRMELSGGKITDVDVGFVKALEAIAHRLAYIEHVLERFK